jgi:hypothetical protein
MKRSVLIVLLLMLAVPCLAFGQAQTAPPPKPGPEVQKLAYHLGTWTTEIDVKAGPSGPAGKISSTGNCEWFAGGFQLVCRGEGTGPMGKSTDLEIFAYDGEAKAYTYYSISSAGEIVSMKGSLTGNTLTWLVDGKAEGNPARIRVTEVQVSPTYFTLTVDYSVAGGPWIVISEAKATKVK